MSYIGKKPVDFNDVTEAQTFGVTGDLTVDTSTLKVDSANNRVGVGTTAPETPVEIRTTNTLGSTFTGTVDGEGLRVTQTNYTSGNFVSLVEAPFDDAQTAANVRIGAMFDGSGSNLAFGTSNSYGSGITNEAMRIDSSARLLVGKTTNAIGTAGHNFNSDGFASHTRDGNYQLGLNRLSDDGALVNFFKDGSNVGLIAADNGDLTIGTGDTGFRFLDGSDAIIPRNTDGTQSDNLLDLGTSGNRFDDIFATNQTIQPSDQTMKQQIASLTDAEITAAKAISKLFKTFKWNDSVETKGDAARTHTGHIAQEVQSAMTDAGLDATKYAFWCSDTFWEKDVEVPAVEADEENGIEAKDAYTRTDTYETADVAPEGATERTRLGIRYPELLAFIGAATEQRLVDIETRLTALEAK
tara:strand:- start:1841 stop:3076 length:1236 start_codon:yes stop_codon:yes gene_type:complete